MAAYLPLMDIAFLKYHALYNDFIIVEQVPDDLPEYKRGELAAAVCHRNTGVGADGVLYLSASDSADIKADLFNADGGWAEKSGNGLRIIGVHLHRSNPEMKSFKVEMGGVVGTVTINETAPEGVIVKASLGKPSFKAEDVPVTTDGDYMINAPLDMAGVELPVTCLAIGNPHTVLFVDSFDLDWRQIGSDIETHPHFPRHTNVEFVRVASRERLEVAEWERGVGETASSGTGAAAAVCAAVMNGFTERKCEVAFEVGSLLVEWIEETDEVMLTGPVQYVASGTYDYPC